MKRYKKGQYGYRNYHKKIELGKVSIGAALIIAQLIARSLMDSTSWKNILTVMAILSVLPVANVASPLLAAWMYKTPPEAFYKKTVSYEGKSRILYDLIITSKEALMPMDAVAVHPTGVYAFCSARKLDLARTELYFKDMFISHKLDPNVKLMKDEKAFFYRLSSLKPEAEYEDDGSMDYTITLLKNLSM